MPYQHSRWRQVFQAMVGDAVAVLDAVALQHLRDFQRALVNFGVIGPDNGTLDRAGDDLLRAVIPRRMLDDPVTEQGPVLHQTKHPNSPPGALLLAPLRPEAAGKAIKSGIEMNFIAAIGHRKGPYGSIPHAASTMVTAAALLLIGMQASPARAARPLSLGDLFGEGPPKLRGSRHSAKIPLPQPRPPEAPSADAPAADKPAGEPEAKSGGKPAEQAGPAPSAAPQPSACRQALTEEIAIAPSIPDISGPGACGGTDLVRLEAIVLPNKHRVAVTPAATLRCSMASAIADWVRTDIVPITEKLGSEISVLDNFDSYECRGFNRIPGAHLSEHGRANALDVRALKLANGRAISLTDRTVSRDVRESVLHSVCTRFMTVLGPDSDWYHEDHIHLDLSPRRNNYKICQWDVLDPLPQVAPLMPAERPEEAPPREVAAKSEPEKGDAAKPAAAEPPAEEDKPADPPARKPGSTKKRR